MKRKFSGNESGEDIIWFELPNHYVFHYVNSWEE
jgi:carotenoid cleavage dioxygenase-like enzyme